jgi:hypothetical protein
MSLKFPFKFVEVEQTVELREEDGFRRGPPGGGRDKHSRHTKNHRTIWKTEPGDWVALPGFEHKAEAIYNFPLRWVAYLLILITDNV